MPSKRVSATRSKAHIALFDARWEDMVRQAIDVRKNAFAPYSKFKVGSALLTDQGEIFVGCNVENASYGLAICAERSAVVSAVARGKQKFVAIAIAAEPLAAPCGACRQFIFQFGADILVRSFEPKHPKQFREWTSGVLLPDGFEF